MKKILVFCFTFLLIGSFICAKKIENDPPKNKVIAHRGAWKNSGFPQNSLAALRHAIDLHCAGSEFDVRITKDDSLIVVHDPTYHGLSIEQNTYETLSQVLLPNGEKIPTLRSYLEEGLRDNQSTLMVLEIKPSEAGPLKGKEIAEKSWRLVQEMKAQNIVIYISFDFGILQTIRSLEPTASVHYLEGNMSPIEVASQDITGINYHFSVYQRNEDFIQQAKSQGLKINSWTVNDPEIMDWLIIHDFDYITTDEPEILLQKYQKRN